MGSKATHELGCFPGARLRSTFDFGLVTLDIMSLRGDDSGIYTCRAVNQMGEAVSTCTLKVEGRSALREVIGWNDDKWHKSLLVTASNRLFPAPLHKNSAVP